MTEVILLVAVGAAILAAIIAMLISSSKGKIEIAFQDRTYHANESLDVTVRFTGRKPVQLASIALDLTCMIQNTKSHLPHYVERKDAPQNRTVQSGEVVEVRFNFVVPSTLHSITDAIDPELSVFGMNLKKLSQATVYHQRWTLRASARLAGLDVNVSRRLLIRV